MTCVIDHVGPFAVPHRCAPSAACGSQPCSSSHWSASKKKYCLLHSIPANACRITLAASSLTPAGVTRVELVGLLLTALQNLRRNWPPNGSPIESGGGLGQAQPNDCGLPGPTVELIVRGGLGPFSPGFTASCLPATTKSLIPSLT